MSENLLSRRWDAFDAYLFDIDGTLLNCTDAVHYFAFCEALSAVAGKPLNLDGIVVHGNTDQGILRDAFARGGVAESVWRPRRGEIVDRMGAQVEAQQGDLRIQVLPGVEDLLRHLREQGAVLSTATGNFARIGEAKLIHCGLRRFFDLGGYSDGCETRSDVFGAALRRVREVAGAAATVCVVGDTPADVQAAHANGLEVIAVATGIYPQEQLQSEGPELCVPSLLALASESKSLVAGMRS